jgi:hypothetical protein
MTNDFIIISCAFGKRYLEQLDRLEASVKAIYPHFPMMSWRNEQVPGRPHRESLYGFKVHAVRAALDRGFNKIIFLDPACILQHPVDYWFSLNLPVLAVKDDNKLDKMIGQKALAYYGNPDITGWHLVGGSLYVFDFDRHEAHSIFYQWYMSEQDGIFGSQAEQASEKINGHRNDESCMAIAMYSHGVEPVGHDVARYNQNEDSIIIKRHFK